MIDAARPGSSDERRRARNTLIATLAAILACGLAGHLMSGYVVAFAEWVQQQGASAGLYFVVGYSIGVLAWIPGMILTLSAGAIFDPVQGVLWVFIGSTIGSALAFVVARYVARGAVERRFGGNPRFDAIDRAVGEQGLKLVFLLRLSPLFPFTPINFLLGLTRVRFGDYMLASFGMLPGTVLYIYYGRVIGDLAALSEGVGPERDLGYWLLLGIGLAATVAVTILLTRIAQRAVRAQLEPAEPRREEPAA